MVVEPEKSKHLNIIRPIPIKIENSHQNIEKTLAEKKNEIVSDIPVIKHESKMHHKISVIKEEKKLDPDLLLTTDDQKRCFDSLKTVVSQNGWVIDDEHINRFIISREYFQLIFIDLKMRYRYLSQRYENL